MPQRLDNTKWLWCLLAFHAALVWRTVASVSVRTPPGNPSTIEAQAKFFQDFFSVQLSPYKIEFGHVCEDPNTWEQRYEKKDFKNHRDMGKVRWGDKKGGYGEHYWDLNHAGNAGNIGDDGDDGSYRETHHDEPYDEPNHNHASYGHDDAPSYGKNEVSSYGNNREPSYSSDEAPTYGNDDYDPEKASYDIGRAKRAYPKVERTRKAERKHPKQSTSEQESEEEPRAKKHNRYHREQEETAESSQEEDEENEQDEEAYEKPKPKRKQHKHNEDDEKPKEKNQLVLVVTHKDDEEKQQKKSKNQADVPQYLPLNQPALPQYLPQNQNAQNLPPYLPQQQAQLPQYVPKQHLEPPHYVPYEGGAGVRQHQQPEVSAATTVPRLFLEPSTGHVVDRATGQAYVLQPIAPHNNYN